MNLALQQSEIRMNGIDMPLEKLVGNEERLAALLIVSLRIRLGV